jgi:opacity protein-like surface antigen
MNRFLLGTGLVTLSFSALAADLPYRTAAPFVSSASAFSWSGFYAGVLIGGASTRSQSSLTYNNFSDGLGFNSGSAQSTWFNSYAAGTLPSATSIALTPSASCDFDTGNSCGPTFGSSTANNASTSTFQRTNAAIPSHIDSRKLVGALGGEIGYLTQRGSFVFGVALDGMVLSKRDADKWSSTGDYSRREAINGSASYNIPGNDITVTGSVTRQSDGSSQYESSVLVAPKWLSTLRVSAGMAQDRFLAFVSGGLAIGGVNSVISSSYSDSNSSICSGLPGGPSNQSSGLYDGSAAVSFSCGGGANNSPASTGTNSSANWGRSQNDIKYGYVLGGGLGFAVSQNVIAKVEGYYYDLGTVSSVVTGTAQQTTTGSASAATNAASYVVKTKVDGILGRAGVAYKF